MDDKEPKKQDEGKINEEEFKLPKGMVFCNFCHRPTYIVWVHGQGQCAYCHENIDECCSGEQACYNDKDE